MTGLSGVHGDRKELWILDYDVKAHIKDGIGVTYQVSSGNVQAVKRILGWHALQFVSRYTSWPHTRQERRKRGDPVTPSILRAD